ncbi:hypothetical protein [uncultured Bacteroides sp.]|uniref:hypothetical protein n=1 Tax=uncultured Bacteroides sp. TaxID=162156 RepID=UPI0027DDD260|nr:hypothetical protein [uncultured Bacteroides sp.]
MDNSSRLIVKKLLLIPTISSSAVIPLCTTCHLIADGIRKDTNPVKGVNLGEYCISYLFFTGTIYE